MSALHLKLFFDLNRARAIVGRRFDAQLGAVHGIGLNELQLLQTLDQAPERRLRRGELAQQLGVTPSGVTWMLRPLAKRRLVTTEASESDARVAFAVLTEGGRRLVSEAIPSARRLAVELLDAQVDGQELVHFAELMSRLG